MFGLGERTPSAGMELLRDGLPYTLWAHDIGALNPDQNLYGSHPMLLIVHEGDALCTRTRSTALVPGDTLLCTLLACLKASKSVNC